MIMKKYLLLTATAALALASCTSDEFSGTDPNLPQAESEAISFGSGLKNTTRAEHTGADAAALLGNNFVVEGVRVNQNDAQVEVFDHYNVNWADASANTTESNSSNWEYVGIGKHGLSAVSKQTIKFWNYDSKQYDFIAFSYGKSNYVNSVLTEMKYANLGQTVASGNAVYTVTGSAEELAKCYIADLVTLYNRNGVSEFKDAIVTPKFRALGTKVRLAFYETVPGYSVKNVKFYNAAWDGTTATTAAGADAATLFAANAIFPSATSKGTMSIYYPTVGWANSSHGTLSPDYNQAHITFTAGSGTGEALVTTKGFGALNANTAKEDAEKGDDNVFIGRTSATATYAGAAAANYYSIVLPLGTSDNIQIRIEYDLIPTDGSEDIIHVRDARAVVPAAYSDWKPNYAYTYIFKISDKTNGWTGVDGDGAVVEGLTPITFDAVVVDTEDGIQETVTTVATPSITTYQKGVNATSTDEYVPGDIYVSVMEGTSPVTLTLTGTPNYGIYKVTAGEDIINETIVNDMLTGKKANTGITWEYQASTVVNEVPAVDGNTYTISAAKFTGEADATYVFDYVNAGKHGIKIIRVKTQAAAAAGYDYPVSTPYTYTATITTSGNDATFTYAAADYTGTNVLNDLARYLGALYYAGNAAEIQWNGNTYAWDPAAAGNLKGSNWWNATSSKTLVKELTDWYAGNPTATEITIKIDGVDSTITFAHN